MLPVAGDNNRSAITGTGGTPKILFDVRGGATDAGAKSNASRPTSNGKGGARTMSVPDNIMYL